MDSKAPDTRAPQPGAGDRHDGRRIRRGELATVLAFWTFFAVLMAANRLLDPRGSGPQPGFFSAPVALAFFESYLWAAVTLPVFWLTSRFGVERSNWPSRLALFLLVGVGTAVFVDVAVDLFRLHALDVPPWRARGASPVRSIMRLWFLDDLMVFVAVLAAGFAREYFLRYRMRQEEAAKLQAHAARLQAQLAEARLQALRMQINPHFLFNTLHAVSSLVERDPRGVRRMIARLSELLRHTLEGAGEPEVPLKEEIEFLRRYLEIMQVRFQGKLEIEFEVDPMVLGALVPNLILQPLVENGIKHGVSNRTADGRIEVRAERSGDHLLLCVHDNGPGHQIGADAGEIEEGVGLGNTRARLAQMYGDDQSLTLRRMEGGGLSAEIRLPYHTAADLRAPAVSPEPADLAV